MSQYSLCSWTRNADRMFCTVAATVSPPQRTSGERIVWAEPSNYLEARSVCFRDFCKAGYPGEAYSMIRM
ncbi:hypothetical protein FHS20_002007 [Phyllobacterium endophyticum]|nr:hypothetical protein [Phyllobacterium endophyticum]